MINLQRLIYALIFGLIIGLLAFVWSYDRQYSQFEFDTALEAWKFEQTLNGLLASALSLSSLYKSSESVSADEFKTFTDDLKYNNPNITNAAFVILPCAIHFGYAEIPCHSEDYRQSLIKNHDRTWIMYTDRLIIHVPAGDGVGVVTFRLGRALATLFIQDPVCLQNGHPFFCTQTDLRGTEITHDTSVSGWDIKVTFFRNLFRISVWWALAGFFAGTLIMLLIETVQDTLVLKTFTGKCRHGRTD